MLPKLIISQTNKTKFLHLPKLSGIRQELLLKVDTCICGDIVNELPLAQPTVSQHLKELKNAGLIKGDIEGNTICYCIDEKAITKLESYFAMISTTLVKKNKKCC